MTDISPQQGHSTEKKLGHPPAADVPHKLRLTDTDPKAARRAERQVASMFLLSMLMVVLFVVAYIAIDPYTTIYVPVLGEVGDNPGAVSYYEQRRVFAGTPLKPQNLWMTKSGNTARVKGCALFTSDSATMTEQSALALAESMRRTTVVVEIGRAHV